MNTSLSWWSPATCWWSSANCSYTKLETCCCEPRLRCEVVISLSEYLPSLEMIQRFRFQLWPLAVNSCADLFNINASVSFFSSSPWSCGCFTSATPSPSSSSRPVASPPRALRGYWTFSLNRSTSGCPLSSAHLMTSTSTCPSSRSSHKAAGASIGWRFLKCGFLTVVTWCFLL